MATVEETALLVLKEIGFAKKRVEALSKVLALKDAKNVKDMCIKTEFHSRRFAYGGQLWRKNDPLDIRVEVELYEDFRSIDELKTFLCAHDLPGERAFSYCQSSYGLLLFESEPLAIDNGYAGIDVHFYSAYKKV